NAAEREVRQQRGTLLPKLDFESSMSRDLTTRTGDRDSRTNSVQGFLRLSVPLYQGGGEWAQNRAASQREIQALYDLERAIKQADFDAIAAWEGYQSALKQVKQYEDQIKHAQRTLEGTTYEVEQGQRVYLDILDASRELLQAKTGLAEALSNLIIAQYQILF